MAIFSLVPTPSVAETRIGSIKPAFFRSKTPPKLPTFPATPGMFVFLTFGLIKLILVVLASLIGNSQPTILIGSLLNFNIIFPSPNVGFFSLISSSI